MYLPSLDVMDLWTMPFVIAGILGALKGIGKAALGGVGGFLTGGPAGAIGGALGPILGGGAEGAATGRLSENQQRLLQDRNILDRARLGQQGILDQASLQQSGDIGRAGVDLSQRQFQETAPLGRLQQSLAGNRILGFGEADAARQGRGANAFTGRATFDPGDFTANQDLADLASVVQQRALAAQRAGDQFDPLQAPEINLPQTPELSQLKGPGVLEKIGNIGGTVGGILGGIGQATSARTPPLRQGGVRTEGILRNLRGQFGG